MKKDPLSKAFQASAKYILGETTGVKIKGSPERVIAFQEVLLASRHLYRALTERRSLPEISDLLRVKRKTAADFNRVTGLVWVL